MRTRLVPRTNLEASVLCLGTAEFGSVVEDSVSDTIINRYLEAGGNVLDTAEVYAEWIPGGSHRSEEFLGQWLRKRKSRDGLILSTKGAHPRLHSMHIPRMSKQDVESDLNSSLRRLGVDCVDIYWLHRDDVATPVEEILLMLEEFRKSGKIRYAGFSKLDTSSCGRSADHGREAECPGVHRKPKSMELSESGCLTRRSNLGLSSMNLLLVGTPSMASRHFPTPLKQTDISDDWITAALRRRPTL